MEVLEGQDGELDAMKDEMLLESDQHDMASDDDMGRRALVEALRLNAFRSGALSFPDDSLPFSNRRTACTLLFLSTIHVLSHCLTREGVRMRMNVEERENEGNRRQTVWDTCRGSDK